MCYQFTVSGRVQGVFFRASTRDTAVSLGIAGSAVNLPDGNVEIIACGTQPALEELRAWLRDGPPMARVEDITEKAIDCREPRQFETG